MKLKDKSKYINKFRNTEWTLHKLEEDKWLLEREYGMGTISTEAEMIEILERCFDEVEE